MSVEYGFKNHYKDRTNRVLGLITQPRQVPVTTEFISFEHLLFAWAVFIVGLLIGCVVFIIEKYCNIWFCK